MAYKIDLKTEPVPTVPKLLRGAEADMLLYQGKMLLAIAERLEVIADELRQKE